MHQGGAVSIEDTGFYPELYAALRHIMLAPLLDSSFQGGGGSNGDAGSDEQEEDELLASALVADDQADTKIGGQVRALLGGGLQCAWQ